MQAELSKIQCPGCGKSLKVPEGMGGKKIKCPSCGERLGVTEPEQTFVSRSLEMTTRTATAIGTGTLVAFRFAGGRLLAFFRWLKDVESEYKKDCGATPAQGLTSERPESRKVGVPICQLCGSQMYKTTTGVFGYMIGMVIGIVGFFCGLALLLTGILFIPGLILMVLSLGCGLRRPKRVIKCSGCGAVHNR